MEFEDSESDPDFVNNAVYEYDRSTARKSGQSKGAKRKEVLSSRVSGM